MTTFSDEVNARTKTAWVYARDIAAHQGGGASKWYGLGHLIAALPEPEPALIQCASEPEPEQVEVGHTIAVYHSDSDTYSTAEVQIVTINTQPLLAVWLPLRSIPHYTANPHGYWAKRGNRVTGQQLWCYLEHPHRLSRSHSNSNQINFAIRHLADPPIDGCGHCGLGVLM